MMVWSQEVTGNIYTEEGLGFGSFVSSSQEFVGSPDGLHMLLCSASARTFVVAGFSHDDY